MEKEFVCKFCNKKFPSGKSLGGHIRIHSPQSSVHSDGFIGKNNNSKKRLVDQRALASHNYEGKKMEMDTQSASETTTTTSSGPTTMIKRSKKQSSSESFSTVSWSSDPGIDQGSKDLMFLHLGRKDFNLPVNSLVPESSENNSEILETKSSSGELLKTPHKVAVGDDSDDSDDNGSSDSDYFMSGPKKSDVSVGGSLRNTGVGSGFNSFKNGDELGVKERGSKHELGKSKRVSPSYGSDSYEDKKNSKFHRSSDGGMVKKASGGDKNSKGHECPVCFKVYSSGQALGGHKRSHTIANQAQQRAKRNAADMQFDLYLPAEEDSDDD
ncbi:unnamed protein product [Brassica rapa]|uniref:C2H2-type domain-containing protein n=1 Tax=Brassica campestris TaxID=3711 RepID=A0A3P5YGF1_BRACM|nr:unnamed protein product [Brassica rapa]VDC61885.1 unnamed protein product [Brassica rapa]